jgi:hypothetical protein
VADEFPSVGSRVKVLNAGKYTGEHGTATKLDDHGAGKMLEIQLDGGHKISVTSPRDVSHEE